ncbi:hypothetical protein CQW23_31839 [Capsicum baccatum]|uniref:SEC63 domain-containing protein n=1 Tax=Capsicum baccatum TaxID=33114 RepID=A0A2G2V6N5_CAPBA|nr:hypothetical protein CQW23_31839 [Capsicum baccatum]
MDINHFCEGYPYIDLTYDVLGGGNVRAGDNVTLQVTLERDLKGRSERKSRIKLDFTAPAEAGTRKYKLYFMCDSYLGCDEEHIFALDVKEASVEE